MATGTPLIYTYINRYGRFEVDFGRRITFVREKSRMSVMMGIPVMTGWMNTPRPGFHVHFGWFPDKWTTYVQGTPKMNSSSARIGYARVSTADQNFDAQMAALEAAGCTMVHTETGDGTTLGGRPELRTILNFIHPDETLVVTRIDRLARSMRMSAGHPRRQRTGSVCF